MFFWRGNQTLGVLPEKPEWLQILFDLPCFPV